MKGGHDYEFERNTPHGLKQYTCALCGKTFLRVGYRTLPKERCEQHVIDPKADEGCVVLTETLPLHEKHDMREGEVCRVLDTRAGEMWVMGGAGVPIKLEPHEYERRSP